MPVFRALILLALLASAGLFVAYALTGRVQLRRYGLVVLSGTLAAAFVFFAVLIIDQLA